MHSTHPAIDRMLEKYDLSTPERTYEALREILQEIVLLGLSRAGFFDHAVFYGGTALRYSMDLTGSPRIWIFHLLRQIPISIYLPMKRVLSRLCILSASRQVYR